MRVVLIFLISLMFPLISNAQSCCSGGVPMAGNLGLPLGEEGTIQTSISYDLNLLRTLKAEAETLDDDSRLRTTQSVLLTLGYTFSKRLAIEGFVSWVRQERTITQFGNEDFTYTQGLGDAVVLVKYLVSRPDHPRHAWQLGAGVKAPTGNPDKTRPDGIPLSLDLQPGSGAWDLLFWTRYSYNFAVRPSMTFSTTVTVNQRGTYEDYLGAIPYKVGNEIQILSGLSDRFTFGTINIDPSISFRYRRASRDVNQNRDQVNTGGDFVFWVPGISYPISPRLSFQANTELPVYSRADGTQLVPTIRVNAGLYLTIGKKAQSLNVIEP